MLSIPGKSGRTCDGWSRRELKRVGGLSLLGVSLPGVPRMEAKAAPARTESKIQPRAKRFLRVERVLRESVRFVERERYVAGSLRPPQVAAIYHSLGIDPRQRLYFLPEPQGQGELRPTFGWGGGGYVACPDEIERRSANARGAASASCTITGGPSTSLAVATKCRQSRSSTK